MPVTDMPAKSEQLRIRVTPDEKELLKKYAYIRGDSLSDVLRELGVDEALDIARRVEERLASD